jgi:hypothetical protein
LTLFAQKTFIIFQVLLMRKLILSILSILPLLGFLRPAAAQQGGKVNLYGLETGAFPEMTATLDVYDQKGSFITGLKAEEVTLLEDGQNLSVDSLIDTQPGVRFVVAVDPGPYFAYRDAYAVTRYDKVLAALRAWGELHPDTLGDDISLVPAGGEPALHLAGTEAFLEALASYQPDLNKLVPTPVTLATAMDIVSGQTPIPGMKSVVLYITSLPEVASLPVLQNLAQRAVQANICIHIWMIAPLDLSATARAASLKDLALQTRGQVFLFSGKEEFPYLEGLLAAQRHAYQMTYTSSIRTSGSHTLTANISAAGAGISSELSFALDVQPPNPILTGLPAQIVRLAPDEKTTDPAVFKPRQQKVEIIIEFPDGRKRPLVRTMLSVDGELVDENTSPPFDVFEWDLSNYATSGNHTLVVEAVDNLGLRRESLGIPVLVTVVQPQVGLLPWLSRNSTWVAGGAILLAGAGLALTIVRRQAGKKAPAGRGAGAKTIPGCLPDAPEGGWRTHPGQTHPHHPPGDDLWSQPGGSLAPLERSLGIPPACQDQRKGRKIHHL